LLALDSLPGGVEGDTAAKALVTLFFLVTSIKSRQVTCPVHGEDEIKFAKLKERNLVRAMRL